MRMGLIRGDSFFFRIRNFQTWIIKQFIAWEVLMMRLLNECYNKAQTLQLVAGYTRPVLSSNIWFEPQQSIYCYGFNFVMPFSALLNITLNSYWNDLKPILLSNTYSGVLLKWEFFIEMRAAYFAPSFLKKWGVLEWRWLQVGTSHFNEKFSLQNHPEDMFGKIKSLFSSQHWVAVDDTYCIV